MIEKTYNVGIYCRLSNDDERDGESASIENQKLLLQRYVRERGWNEIDVYTEIIVPYMIRLRLGDFIKECKNLLIYRLSDAKRCAKALFFVCEFRSTVSVTVRWVYDH